MISFACSVFLTLTSIGWIQVEDDGMDDDDALPRRSVLKTTLVLIIVSALHLI